MSVKLSREADSTSSRPGFSFVARDTFMLSAGRIILLLALAMGLSACQAPFWIKKKQPPPPPPAPVVQKPAPITKEQQVVNMLILNGEYTLSQNQLLTPKMTTPSIIFARL